MEKEIANSKAVLTLAEAAEYMGLKKSYLYRLTHEKRISDYSGLNVPLVAVCNVPPIAFSNVPPQKWLL